uniref:Uncharacterized protein n=1 Tax=Triticum urartu TaxID=4572 RepID=A0A8R7PP05_TRIUA
LQLPRLQRHHDGQPGCRHEHDRGRAGGAALPARDRLHRGQHQRVRGLPAPPGHGRRLARGRGRWAAACARGVLQHELHGGELRHPRLLRAPPRQVPAVQQPDGPPRRQRLGRRRARRQRHGQRPRRGRGRRGEVVLAGVPVRRPQRHRHAQRPPRRGRVGRVRRRRARPARVRRGWRGAEAARSPHRRAALSRRPAHHADRDGWVLRRHGPRCLPRRP